MIEDHPSRQAAGDSEGLRMPEPKLFVESICEDNRKFYDDKRGLGALKDLQQTFPHPWLYVAELLQNAVDAGSTRIALTLRDDQSVIFEHNGDKFSPEDVDALCSRGVSTKGANTVGFMGVGFKSVFRSFEEAQISSGPWRFALGVAATRGEEYGDQQRHWLGAVLPRWDPSAKSPSPGMNCRFVLSKRLPHLPSPTEDLDHVLGEGQTLLALLAWQGVKELRWNGKLCLLKSDESPLGDTGDRRVILEATHDEGNPFRRWALLSKRYQPSRQAIARFLEHRQLAPPAEERERVYREASQRRQVAVFCEIDGRDNPITPDRGSAFALLPTGVTFPLGLHVQADWLLVVTRREIMQIEGNEWHEEILKQLPSLIRYYLEWLVGARDRFDGEWHRGYDAMPGPPMHDVLSDAWFGSKDFLNALRQELRHVLFVPKPTEAGGSITFLSPSRGRFLPKPFAREFEDTDTRPDVLFGDRVVDAHLLGTRASQCLHRLQLVHELAAADLVAYWKSGTVGKWIGLFAEELRNKMLARILQALADLDDVDAWRDAEPVCLPTASGMWTHRGAATRYPADWNVLAQELDIRAALESFVGVPENIISLGFDTMLQQTRSSGRSYLDPIPQPGLNEVVEKWWEQMPLRPTAENIELIVRLTTWVLEKQPQRRNLVTKLLCSNRKAKHTELREASETLLAEPYAGAYRRVFFPDMPTVATIYETQGSTSTRAEWRAFFEKLDPSPKGGFFLSLNEKKKNDIELARLVGKDYRAPWRRSSGLSLEWQGFTIRSNQYTVVNAELPSLLGDIIKQSVTREHFLAMCQWLGESPAFLGNWDTLLLAYIPYGSSYVQKDDLPLKASWTVALANNPWVYTKTGEGPFRPSDVLPAADPVRPDAPVADIEAELLEVLHKCGVRFGVALPNAPAIDRLRIQAPTATDEQLLGLLQDAINEADDEVKKSCLADVLRQRPLFPIPPDRVAPDHATRISQNRLIWSERNRSSLGNWLLPVEHFLEGSLNRQLLELADSFLPIPKSTTFTQVLDFLSWVWTTRPDADLVRRILPRAYGYVKEDVEADPGLLPGWHEILAGACVFVLGKRQWVPVAGAKTLFLDDLNDSGLRDLVPELDLATGGHFGENPSEQVSIAKLLGINLLSSRFRVVLEPHGPQNVPDYWQEGFSAVQNWLRGQVSKSDDADLEATGFPMQSLQISRWENLQTVLYDYGEPVQRNHVRAAFWKSGNVAVNGMPEDFAEELCKILFNQWGLRLRRDLVELIPRVAIQLTRINDPAVVERWQSEGLPEKTPQQRSTTEAAKSTQLPQPQPLLLNSDGVSTTVEPEGPSEVMGTEITCDQSPDLIAPGGSYTEDIRESRIRALIEKKDELDQKIHNALTLHVTPAEPPEPTAQHPGQFRSDDVYRDAAMRYETDNHRYAHAKAPTQSGHDIDSYTHPEGNLERKLVRRIEVKGRSTRWDLDEIVEMSDIQFKDALSVSVPADMSIDSDFDYWLYVVERREDGELRVLPLRNVARQAAHFALKGGSWRYIAEQDEDTSNEQFNDGSALRAASK